MLPVDLKPASFAQYPPEGRAFAVANLDLLRRLPLSLLPILLVEIIQYDFGFPAERAQIAAQVSAMAKLDSSSLSACMRPLFQLEPPPGLQRLDWVNHPEEFAERLTAWLWAEQRIDSYHAAAEGLRRQLALPEPSSSAMPRWTLVLLGHGIRRESQPVFRRLAPYGVTFRNIDPSGGASSIFAKASARARQVPDAYAHWYIEGGEPLAADGLTTTGFRQLVPAAQKEFQYLQRFSASRTRGDRGAAEAVSSYMASLTPEKLGLTRGDAPLRYFEARLLTQGAGCQVFSTTFVQWAARECLHRAQPLTLVARFGTRQRTAPMEQLLSRDPLSQAQDPDGSLIDADMGAYYTWINQSRLPGSERARFLAWWEGEGIAFASSPLLPRNTESGERATIEQIISWMG